MRNRHRQLLHRCLLGVDRASATGPTSPPAAPNACTGDTHKAVGHPCSYDWEEGSGDDDAAATAEPRAKRRRRSESADGAPSAAAGLGGCGRSPKRRRLCEDRAASDGLFTPHAALTTTAATPMGGCGVPERAGPLHYLTPWTRPSPPPPPPALHRSDSPPTLPPAQPENDNDENDTLPLLLSSDDDDLTAAEKGTHARPAGHRARIHSGVGQYLQRLRRGRHDPHWFQRWDGRKRRARRERARDVPAHHSTPSTVFPASSRGEGKPQEAARRLRQFLEYTAPHGRPGEVSEAELDHYLTLEGYYASQPVQIPPPAHPHSRP